MKVQRISNHQQSFGMAKLGKNLGELFDYALKDCHSGRDFQQLDKAKKGLEELPFEVIELQEKKPQSLLKTIFSLPSEVVDVDNKYTITITTFPEDTLLTKAIRIHNGTKVGLNRVINEQRLKQGLEESSRMLKESLHELFQLIKAKFKKSKVKK